MVLYVSEEQLEKMFKERGVESLPIESDEELDFVDRVVNFLTNQVTRGKFGVSFNRHIEKQERFSSYRQSLRYSFNRILVVLERLELSDIQIKRIVSPLIDFIEGAEDLDNRSWQYLAKFLARRIDSFTPDNITTIIKSAAWGKIHRLDYDVFDTICKAASEKAHFTLTDKELLDKLIKVAMAPCKQCLQEHNTKYLLSLWHISDDEGKVLVKSAIVNHLSHAFDSYYYALAIRKNILIKTDDNTLLAQYISELSKECHEYDFYVEHDTLVFRSFSGLNGINNLAYMGVDFNHPEIQQIAEVSDYYAWLINPHLYDYSKFDTRLLSEVGIHYIKDRLRGITPLKELIIKELKTKYNEALAKFFLEYMLEH